MTIERKKKTCTGCNTLQYIWAKKQCKACHSRNITTKKLIGKNKPINDYFGYSSQKEMFLDLWDKSGKICPISKLTLKQFEGSIMFWNLFAHVLPKGKYPKFKLNPQNILIVHPDVHYLYDSGTEKDRINSGYDFTLLYNLKVQLFIEYNKFLKLST